MPQPSGPRKRSVVRKGIGVAPGVAVGKAYCIHEIYLDSQTVRLPPDEAMAELRRFEEAREKAAADLRALYHKVAAQVGSEQAAIFQAHETILYDPAFTSKVRGWIADQHLPAQTALHRLMQEYTELFQRTKDEYLRERLVDVRDVILRLSQHLSPALQPESINLSGPVVLVADELLPSQAIALGDLDVAGIVTETGGQTSHAAILARKRGIPSVTGLPGVLRQVHNGDTVVVDGRTGHVQVNPDTESEAAFRILQREFFDLKDHLAKNRDVPARTACGKDIALLANINSLPDAHAAVAMGATGVGLYRTEYLFLTHSDVPDEEEQFEAYREIFAACPPGPITIRSLDLGGDKTIPYLGHAHEANPFLGWRSIRLSFEHPEFFQTQIRAVLRAAAACDRAKHPVQLLFPMITTLEEMRRVRGMVNRARSRLQQEHKPYTHVPLGLMLEVPAAAVMIESLLEVADFVSIGSNDLVQYLMAADRDNPKVSHLCDPLSPAVLETLRRVIAACNHAGKPVTLCGEMAGQTSAYPLLLGMGLRQFSMSPAFIPTIKELASKISQAEAERLLRRALELKTTGQIHRFLAKQLNRLAPSLGLMVAE